MTKKWIRFCFLFMTILIITTSLLGCDAQELLSKVIEYTNEVEVDEFERLKSHAKENGYEKFVNYMENELSESEQNIILDELDGEVIEGGLKKINHNEVSADHDYCYLDETYIIPYRVYKTVKWSQNIEIDPNNESTICRRFYRVIDSENDAYMLIDDEKNGYQLIQILAKDSSENDEVKADYTKEGFFTLLEYFKSRVKILLIGVVEKAEITRDDLLQLYAYEQDFARLYVYAKNLTGTDYQDVMELFENGYINTGFKTVRIGKDSAEYYYSYKDGVYYLNQKYYQLPRWFQNIEQNGNEYVVSNPKEDAFLLLFGKEDEYILIHFVSN